MAPGGCCQITTTIDGWNHCIEANVVRRKSRAIPLVPPLSLSFRVIKDVLTERGIRVFCLFVEHQRTWPGQKVARKGTLHPATVAGASFI